MTTIMVDAGKKYLVEPNEVVLERDGEVEVYRPPFTYIGEGTWKVSKVTYLGGGHNHERNHRGKHSRYEDNPLKT
jgi:hypothetical protein